jgi:hypothetical protein
MFATFNRKVISQHEITFGAVCGYGHGAIYDGKLGGLFIHTWHLINYFLNFWKVFYLVIVVLLVLLEPRIEIVKVFLLCVPQAFLIFKQDFVVVCLDKPKVGVIQCVIIKLVKYNIYKGVSHSNKWPEWFLKVQSIYGRL